MGLYKSLDSSQHVNFELEKLIATSDNVMWFLLFSAQFTSGELTRTVCLRNAMSPLTMEKVCDY